MSLLIMFSALLFSSLISTTHCVGGKRNLSKEVVDDIEIKRQLRVLNKKPVKTIITEVGDVIDCIYIYKQPAFDNPLLKDHKIQMSPRSISGETRSKNVSASSIFYGLQREQCPSGTVPIRRVTREDLVNAKFFAMKVEQIHANGFPNIGARFVYAAEVIRGKKYFGGAASMSIHNLTVDPDQFSTSQIWIVNSTTGDQMNGIQFGIMKNPSVVGGNLPRLFGFWIRDGHHVAGCYNMECHGFIQTNPSVFIGQPFVQSSVYGQRSYDVHIMVYRAHDTGHWWLRMGATAETSENVGYWPNEIFTLLRASASVVRYGGYVGSLIQASTPPMGNGFLPQLQDYDTTAYMRLMKYVNEAGASVDLNSHSVRTNNGTVPQCYNIMFAGQIGGDWGNTIVYGGPGGYCN
ncbi:hypothetical protein MKW98_027292 [Papaver atlanticum]|uniref:Neprosin PEP catalytic domain-containing protein n=1 Tax=Papaver atlanticum TaxID=357466 RepID=A0AAD4SPK7_9MAGN|nr:hypothetical protein MKW98_027292 [Papaver atlanticum]